MRRQGCRDSGHDCILQMSEELSNEESKDLSSAGPDGRTRLMGVSYRKVDFNETLEEIPERSV